MRRAVLKEYTSNYINYVSDYDPATVWQPDTSIISEYVSARPRSCSAPDDPCTASLEERR